MRPPSSGRLRLTGLTESNTNRAAKAEETGEEQGREKRQLAATKTVASTLGVSLSPGPVGADGVHSMQFVSVPVEASGEFSRPRSRGGGSSRIAPHSETLF